MQIRRGGVQTPEGFRFELTGGHLCLDFANTLDSRPAEEPRELVRSYADLVSWSAQAGAIEPSEAPRLLRLAARHPARAESVLARALEVREAIFSVCSDLAAGRGPRSEPLERIEGCLRRALGRRRLAREGAGFAWRWAPAPESLDPMLWPVAQSAAELLTSPDLGRLRECAADNCAWLFLDRSRNGTRRWCDMTVCGNRSKARRFYARSRGPVRQG
jgi:predicted RNA-binding Zn ribbon-like protein